MPHSTTIITADTKKIPQYSRICRTLGTHCNVFLLMVRQTVDAQPQLIQALINFALIKFKRDIKLNIARATTN